MVGMKPSQIISRIQSALAVHYKVHTINPEARDNLLEASVQLHRVNDDISGIGFHTDRIIEGHSSSLKKLSESVALEELTI